MGSGFAKAQSHWRLSVGRTGLWTGLRGVVGPRVSGLVICARVAIAAVMSSVMATSWSVRRIVGCEKQIPFGNDKKKNKDYTAWSDCCLSMDWASASCTSLPISCVVTLAAGVAAGDVGGAVTGGENLVDRGFDGERVFFEACGVTEQHRGGEDGAEGIGLALTGDVGRGAVYGLVEVDLAAECGRRQHAE